MRERKNNKKKWMGILVAAIIVFSMVISIFAVVVDNQSQSLPDYNKHSFMNTNNGYKTKINGKYIEFYNYPSDLERITIETGVMAKIKNSQGMAFIFNPEEPVVDNLQYIDLIRYDLQSQLDKPTYFGITQNSTKYTLPIIGCANATAEFPLILINVSSNTSFYVSEEYPNCIIMNAKLRDLLAAKDRLVYTYYGVMN
jgi:hypothetical protein